MLGIASRLVQAQQASSPTLHEDNQQRIAGRQGEEKVVDLLRKLGGVHALDLFRALRVPDEFQTRRHEIDLVLVTGYGIYCIEIKNWSGKLTVCKDPMYWEQTKISDPSKPHSRQIQYFNPVTEVKKKMVVLRNHLMRAGICLSEKKFFSRVVLINENCDVDEAITSDPGVITQDRITEFSSSFSRTMSDILTDPFIPYFIRGQLSYTQMEQTRAALNHIGTWDVLNLNGGRQLVGDYKGCAELSFNRKDVEEMVFAHQRNATTASVWAVFGYSPSVKVTLFKRGGAGWFSRETTGTVTVPYNLDIGFRIAGETADAKIPANDIDRIVLSN